MSATDMLWDYAKEGCWDALFQLEVCLEYIERQDSDEAFGDFLAQIKEATKQK